MISHEPVKLYQLIESGERLRDKHLESVKDQIRRYHGPWFYGQGPALDEEYDPANLAYQYVSLVLPILAWDNPRFEVSTKRGPRIEPVALALKYALDRWAVDTDVQETMEAAAVDYLFAYAVYLTEMEPSPDQDPTGADPRKRPVVNRLDPRRYGMDPYADNPRDARIKWHAWARDKDDLLREAEENPDAGWNVETIKRVAVDAGLEKLQRDEHVEQVSGRDEIVGYQVWIPEWELPEVAKLKPKERRKFHGTLVDLVVAGSTDGTTPKGVPQFIRDPRPFFGPKWGPYSVVGAYKVPGKLYPLGPLTAVEGQNRELNQHKISFLKAARARKKIGLASDKDPMLAETINDTPEGQVALGSIDNLDRNFREIELGGPTEEQRLTILGLQGDVDAALGMSDAKRGEVSGIGTATENAIADAAGNQRLSWKKKRFRKGTNDAMRTAAWYLWESEDVEVVLGPEASEELGVPEGVTFRGGDPEGEGALKAKVPFEDLEIEIEIMSTERLDEGVAQARAVQVFTMMAQTVPAIVAAPMAGWKEAFDLVGEALNMPDLGEKLGIARVQEAAMQGALPQQQQEQAAAQPRMSGDRASAQAGRRPQVSATANRGQRSSPTQAPARKQIRQARKAGVA